MENKDGICAQIAFGMDNSYKCELEIWGSKGCLSTERIFTAPDGYRPTVVYVSTSGKRTEVLSSDDHFRNSIGRFVEYTRVGNKSGSYKAIRRQAYAVERVREMSR